MERTDVPLIGQQQIPDWHGVLADCGGTSADTPTYRYENRRDKNTRNTGYLGKVSARALLLQKGVKGKPIKMYSSHTPAYIIYNRQIWKLFIQWP